MLVVSELFWISRFVLSCCGMVLRACVFCFVCGRVFWVCLGEVRVFGVAMWFGFLVLRLTVCWDGLLC